MAPAIKVKMRYAEGGEELHYVIKFKVPKKWKPQTTVKLKDQFVESYNAKHGEKNILKVDKKNYKSPFGRRLLLLDLDITLEKIELEGLSKKQVDIKENIKIQEKTI